MDTYTVEFRIEGLSLVPSEVTKTLELIPSLTSAYQANKNRKPFWGYDGVSSENNFIERKWLSLEEGLEFVLDKLLPKNELIKSEFSQYKTYLWCAHFQESFNGGPRFSPKLLKKLSDFDTEVIIKTHYCV